MIQIMYLLFLLECWCFTYLLKSLLNGTKSLSYLYEIDYIIIITFEFIVEIQFDILWDYEDFMPWLEWKYVHCFYLKTGLTYLVYLLKIPWIEEKYFCFLWYYGGFLCSLIYIIVKHYFIIYLLKFLENERNIFDSWLVLHHDSD